MPFKPIPLLLTAAILAAAPGYASAPVKAGLRWSWGKPRVSIDEYRRDAVECARGAVTLDISDTDPAKAMVMATRLTDDAEAGSYLLVKRMIAPDRQFQKVSDVQYGTLNECLAARGYRPFRLSEAQKARIRRLEKGSDERRAYLHRLASDPAVLEEQGTR